jgi:type IV pilus assembly protein PilO
MAATLTKEEQQAGIVAIMFGIIIVVIFYISWFKPQNEKLNGLAAQEAELKKTVDKDASYVEGPESQAKIAELKARIAKFEQQLPNDKEIPELLSFLKKIANDSDIEYVSIVAQPLAPSEFYIEIPFNVVLRGKYHNIGQMINQIENYKRLMKVDNVDISEGNEKGLQHNVGLKLSTYVFNPNPSQAGK